ncbi:MAG: hypothetical protein HWN66_09550 [Candidatus Helarchaeota archaeon]|nr:hypothetical protein [Candidatus Helarchaeota archaeon]
MHETIVLGRIGFVVENICLNANVDLLGWALYDIDGLPLYSKVKTHEDEFGAMAANVVEIYKRMPELTGSCFYFPDMNLFLHRIKVDMKYFVLTIAIEKNIRNHGLVALQILKYEERFREILVQKGLY